MWRLSPAKKWFSSVSLAMLMVDPPNGPLIISDLDWTVGWLIGLIYGWLEPAPKVSPNVYISLQFDGFFWQFEFRTASQFFRFNWKVQLIKRSLCSTLETMVRCFCTFNVVLIVIPTMFPLCNFLAKDAILVVKPYVCFTTKIFDIFALWFISFLSISFSDVIVLRSIWSTWVTKDTIQGAKRVLITLSGGGWSRVHYLRNDPSCFLRPSSRSPREVFLLRGFLFFLIESWE